MHLRPYLNSPRKAHSLRRRLIAAGAAFTALAIFAIPGVAFADSSDTAAPQPPVAVTSDTGVIVPATPAQLAAAAPYYPTGAKIIVIYQSPNGDITFIDGNGNVITIDIYGNIISVNGNPNIPPIYTTPPAGGGAMGSSTSSCPAGDGNTLVPVWTPYGLVYVHGAGGGVGGWTSNGPWGLTTCVTPPSGY